MYGRMGLFLLLTLFFTIVLGGIQESTGLFAGQVILPQLAPGLAALAILLVFRKDAAAPNFSLKPIASLSSLLAVLFPVGTALILFIIVTQITRLLDIASILPANAPLSLIGMIIGAVGEELGWRGYLHRMLDQRMAGWLSSLMVGAIWALWHMGLYQNGPIFMLFVVILMISYSSVLYFIVQKIGFNVWIAGSFHLMINVTNVTFLSVLTRLDFMIINALVWAAVAGMVVLLNRPLFSINLKGKAFPQLTVKNEN